MTSLTGNSQQPRQIPELNKVSVLLLLTATRSQVIKYHKVNHFVEKSHDHALPEKINLMQIFQSESLQLFSGKGWVTPWLFNCLHTWVWVTNTSYVFKKLSICYSVPSANVFCHLLSSNLKLSLSLKARGSTKEVSGRKSKANLLPAEPEPPPAPSDTEPCCLWAPHTSSICHLLCCITCSVLVIC